jgi:phage N-6-adenine-methyltransferase
MRFDDRFNKEATKDEWLTPRFVLNALGAFDLDPCAPVAPPWRMAARHYTIEDNGLLQDWGEARVWLNPPYGLVARRWLKRLAQHGNGIALIPARTETIMWFDSIWYKADALLFFKGRLTFHHVTGEAASMTSGAPSVLVAYGKHNAEVLRTCGLAGAYVPLRHTHGDAHEES